MAEKPTIEQLQQQIAALETELGRLTGRYHGPEAEQEEQADYVAHGSDEHAALLGLKKAEEGEEFELDGWTLEDITAWGPAARPDFLMRILRQKVNELTMKIPETQSKDPRRPNFAPIMWRPGQKLSQITE